jgi:hypothetical protein
LKGSKLEHVHCPLLLLQRLLQLVLAVLMGLAGEKKKAR